MTKAASRTLSIGEDIDTRGLVANTAAKKPNGIDRGMDGLFARAANLNALIDTLERSTSWFRRPEEPVPPAPENKIAASASSPAARGLDDLADRLNNSIKHINYIITTIDTSLTA